MPTLALSNVLSDRWEITLEDLPAPVTKITLSADGVYVEAGRQSWDLIPWPELAALIDDGPHAHQPRHLAIQQRQDLLRRILAMPGVIAMAGPMPQPEPAEMW